MNSNNIKIKNIFLVFNLIFLLNYVIDLKGQNLNYKKTKSGLEYKIIVNGKGEKTKADSRVFIRYNTLINDDSLFDTNPDKFKPYAFIIGENEGLLGWDEALSLLRVGDSAHFRIPPNLAFGNKKVGKLPINTTLLFQVKVLGLQQAYYNLISKDSSIFESGLKKRLVAHSTSKKVTPFNYVRLEFTGYILTDAGKKRIFESSLSNSSRAFFQLGGGNFIKGLEEGINTMRIGEKATFIVPPHLGYGSEKNGIISANSTLYFDIELLEEINPFMNIQNFDTIYDKTGVKIIKLNTTNKLAVRDDRVAVINCLSYYINQQGNRIIFDNTIVNNKTITLRSGSKKHIKGLSIGINYLKEGEKALVIIPSELGFGSRVIGTIPPNTKLYYQIEVVTVFSFPFYDTFKKDTIVLSSGLKYIDVNKIKSDKITTNGDNVMILYTGFYSDSTGKSTIFDTSRENEKPLEFLIGDGKVIKGFEEGVRGMSIGDARRLIIPYKLAYGENGIPEAGIPKKTNLIFDIELININPNNQKSENKLIK